MAEKAAALQQREENVAQREQALQQRESAIPRREEAVAQRETTLLPREERLNSLQTNLQQRVLRRVVARVAVVVLRDALERLKVEDGRAADEQLELLPPEELQAVAAAPAAEARDNTKRETVAERSSACARSTVHQWGRKGGHARCA